MRQQIRKTCIAIAFLSLPVTFCYISPVILVQDAAKGIASGSLIVYAAVFVTSIFTGRSFCAWVCPCGGGQELLTLVNAKPLRRGHGNRHRIKYVISAALVAATIFMAIKAGGYTVFDFFNHTEGGFSLIADSRSKAYPIYFIVMAAFLTLTLLFGRRFFCRYLCWLAPLTILGARIHEALKLPGFRLKSKGAACVGCRKCDAACPMSLPVSEMVRADCARSSECILCGACDDACPKKAVSLG